MFQLDDSSQGGRTLLWEILLSPCLTFLLACPSAFPRLVSFLLVPRDAGVVGAENEKDANALPAGVEESNIST